MTNIDTAMLAQLVFLAYLLQQFTDALLKPIVEIVNLFLRALTVPAEEATELRKQAVALIIQRWPLYLTALAGGGLAWFTGLNALPVFQPEALGRVLTAIGIGLGPSFINDLKPS